MGERKKKAKCRKKERKPCLLPGEKKEKDEERKRAVASVEE